MKICACFLILFLTLFNTNLLHGQSAYHDSIASYWAKYKADLLSDERKPIKPEDMKYLNFFPTDSKYKVKAKFTRIVDTIGFDIPTQSGKFKKHFTYGTLNFKLNGKRQQLLIYQSALLMTRQGYEDYLFLPFTDNTNYNTTYGGGRYLDFKLSDIQNGYLEIDFNKAYNPYCAFSTGFNCPIPPAENRMKIAIKAGEMKFGKVHD